MFLAEHNPGTKFGFSFLKAAKELSFGSAIQPTKIRTHNMNRLQPMAMLHEETIL